MILALAGGTAHADVDWAKGVVTASGIGIADRHAPSPAAAREPARRAAEDAARVKLSAALPSLPLATGGKLAGKLGDAAIKARIEAVVASALTVDAIPQTDGSWNVTLAVPLEAVRQALVGPRVLGKADDDPAVVIVEGVTAKPAIGYTVGGIAGATLWVGQLPAWAKDAPHVKVSSTNAGAIKTVVKEGGPSTLYLLVK
jgi:hypothetical protein